MKKPRSITDKELEYVRERTLAGDSLSMIAKTLKRSSKTICRCRAHLGVQGVGTPSMTEKEKETIIKLARKGWTTTKISEFVSRSHSSVLKVCRTVGIKASKQLGGKTESSKLRALSFLSLGYSFQKVANLACVEEDLVVLWAKEDLDAKLPKKRVSKEVSLNWIRVEDEDGTETWQCRETLHQVTLTKRDVKIWILLDPWEEGSFKSRKEALDAARGILGILETE